MNGGGGNDTEGKKSKSPKRSLLAVSVLLIRLRGGDKAGESQGVTGEDEEGFTVAPLALCNPMTFIFLEAEGKERQKKRTELQFETKRGGEEGERERESTGISTAFFYLKPHMAWGPLDPLAVARIFPDNSANSNFCHPSGPDNLDSTSGDTTTK
ncbi:hypothetical protein FQN60_006472 [Etheostoma spectabile]|uniref:Uncharacterized protein n=1 Tax=Etheostoma spectabile TaxID=54343 RepID=A0A5J5CTN9_9PERO|nr:hypothetical protein FQN60_006472 [Etheostoma spectabile]